MDLVARLLTRGVPPRSDAPQDWVALVHLEAESADKVAAFRRRMYDYHHHLSRIQELPVLPLAVYLRVGLEGIGWDVYEEYFWEQRIVHFTYPYVGLPALDAEQYVRQDNWLGVALAALMRVSPERRLDLGLEAWRRLLQCPESAYRRYLLCECVDAYMPLNEEQRQFYKQKILTDPDPGVRVMGTTLFEQFKQEGRAEGIVAGRAEGRAEGLRDALLVQLGVKFGPLTPEVRQRVEALPVDKVREALVAMVKAQSLREVGLGE
jgi:hypothetical protein